MAGIDMEDLFSLICKELQPGDVEQLKYILEDSFTGTFEACLEPIRSSAMSTMEMFCKYSQRFFAINS